MPRKNRKMTQSSLSQTPLNDASTSSSHRRHGRPLACALVAVAVAALLSACNESDKDKSGASAPTATPVVPPASGPASATETPASQTADATTTGYQLPPADVLHQLVAPVALYPDKLVAQLLAASTYPGEVVQASEWLKKNPSLIKNDTRLAAANEQPWDASVKALTQFPFVLEQLAASPAWTAALGKAYYNYPTDLLNAIQVMRVRAYQAGSLVSSSELIVKRAAQPTPPANYTPAPDMATNDYPDPVIPPPREYVEISQGQPDTVHVPRYDPSLVFGEIVPRHPDYNHASDPDASSFVGFGPGNVLPQGQEYLPWSWQAWNIHWGQRGANTSGWHPGEPPPPPAARPAVVFNNTTYLSRSPSVMEDARRPSKPNALGKLLSASESVLSPASEPR